MTEVKEAAPVSKVLARDPNKQWEWSIELDKHLRWLIDAEGIEDPDVQMVVCEAFAGARSGGASFIRRRH